MNASLRKLFMALAAAFTLVAALAILNGTAVPSLALRNPSTGKLYARYPLAKDADFSITFVHSVNQSPVTDYYRSGEGKTLILFATKYHAYGAGIPENWPEDAHVSTSGDGIYVTGLHQTLPNVTYIVGTVSDHTLSIGGQDISLRNLCGKNAEVLFEIE